MAEEQNSLKEETVKLKKKIETKFKMVYLKKNESARIIERVRQRGRKSRKQKKHYNGIETWVEEIQDLKGKKKEVMIEGEKELEEVKAPNNQVEADLE